MPQFTDTALLKMDQMIHSGAFCVLPRHAQHSSIHIIALDICLYIPAHQILRFLQGLIPCLFRNQMIPLLRRKIPFHARCDMSCHHSRFDRKCTAAAERVDQNPVRVPRGQLNQRSRQRLRNRRKAAHRTVSAFMQRYPRRINGHGHFILHQKYTNRIFRTCLRKPFHIIVFLHFFHNCFFHNTLDVRRTEQLAFNRRRFGHPEFGVFWQINLPGQRTYPLKQFIICNCPETACF